MTIENPQLSGGQHNDRTGEELRTALVHATELLHRGSPGPADRIAASVVRPLSEALHLVGGPPPPTSTGHDGTEVDEDAFAAALWELTKEVTRLRMRPGMPAQVQEAAAALHDLVARSPAADSPDGITARLAQLSELQTGLAPTIQAELNGPYLVTNVDRITNWLGEPIPARPQMALCRCGSSSTKPLCDGTHAQIGFTSDKDPNRVPDRADTYVGQQVTILDNRGTCQHSGYCTDRLATVFHVGTDPFVTPSGGRMDEIIRAVRDCPSGALSYAIDGREAREQVDSGNRREPSLEVTKDGPYRISGAIRLLGADGNDEGRNQGASYEHYALCRCGHSRNKPFCSGMHWYVEFHDPVPEPDHEPTVFEWCGGLPGLTRMTRLFYEKYVPADPLLAPLFATMSADHPERVAKWLGEVFGGPTSYSEEYGGYTRMLSQHVGKGLTEEERARWVALLLQSANDAGLPNDPEFRSTFGAYIEWGSRLAVENSQTDARPPERMPMPHWDWHTAAGAPGSRVSPVAPQPHEADQPVVLPAVDEPILFDTHIKPLFRQRDRQSMKFAFDLWSYPDVKSHADAILEQVRNGTMPCDGAWPTEWTDVFARWVAAGMSA
jgi:CDGSH-type Zn-finger protein/truncated hemoglobin YjbI